eukprot:TRINITY_DN21949_c0_g1_i1.p1 TRINITY_DN21949_c0_g1~~TRINITY_DN21949_c0_g1_i1.p1  ORF type:complete len:380 (+),score=43.67 TRINITY_DN21949_c0_g1_i1:105-1142(+)
MAERVAILGMDHPIVDIVADVDKAFLERYDVGVDSIRLARKEDMPLYDELAAMPDVRYVAGGATQNSIRVAQWMLRSPGATAYMGCVGTDTFADKLREACARDGVRAHYMVDNDLPTAGCAVMVYDGERSMVTALNCANNYEHTHLQEPEQWEILQQAQVVYSAGYFICASPESIRLCAEEKAKDGGIYCMNLAAPFLMHIPHIKQVFVETMPLVDFLFGNESEAMAWALSEGWETNDVPLIATRLSLIPSAKGKGSRTVVITCGTEATVVAHEGHVAEYPIQLVPRANLVDTNGAGDAYVGGFLAGLVKGMPTKDCCRAGAFAASIIVQHRGCEFPPTPPDFAW